MQLLRNKLHYNKCIQGTTIYLKNLYNNLGLITPPRVIYRVAQKVSHYQMIKKIVLINDIRFIRQIKV